MSEPEERAPFKRDPETLHRQTTNHVFPFPSHTHTLPLFSLFFLLSYSLYYSPSWNQPNVPSSVAGHCCPSARRPLYVQAHPPGWCFWCWVPAPRLHSATTRGTPYRRAYSFICVLWLWGSPGTVKNHPRPPVALSLFPSSRSSPSHPRRPAPTSTKNQPTTPSSRHQRTSPIAYRPSAPSPSASLRLSPPRRPLSRLLPSTTPSIKPPPARLAPRPRLLGSPPVTPTPVGCPAPAPALRVVARPGG